MTQHAEVLELSQAEYDRFLTVEIGRSLGNLTLAEFINAYVRGELSDADPEVARLVALVGIGQNGR